MGEDAGQLVGDGLELQLVEDGGEGGQVRHVELAGMPVDVAQWNVDVDGGEAQRLAGEVDVGGDLLSQLASDLGEVGEEVLHGAPFLEELGGGLVADAGDAGDVVGRVAGKALVVDDLGGGETVLLLDGGDVHADELGAGLGPEDVDPVIDELEGVAIARDDQDVVALLARLLGNGPDEVVGLVAVNLVDGKLEGPHDRPDEVHLRPQVVGHRLTVGLVVGEFLMAEGRRGTVEGDGHAVRAVGFDDVEDGPQEAVNGPGRASVLGTEVHALEGEEGAVSERVPIDEHEAFSGSGGHGGGG
ncbi:hypothetical protein D3C87_1157230 [compost metagenome]